MEFELIERYICFVPWRDFTTWVNSLEISVNNMSSCIKLSSE